MAKIVVKSLKSGSKDAARSVRPKRIAKVDGRWKTVTTLDANSATLDRDLHYVFGKNVAKARRENKRVLGLTDRAPAKVKV